MVDAREEAKWKRRFFVSMTVRLASLALFMLGIAVAYSDILRPGGWPQLGAILAITGALDAVFAPRMLRRKWDQDDRA